MIFILASIVLMTSDHRYGHLESLRSALSIFVYPVQYIVNLPVRFARWTSETLDTRTSLLEDNQKLHQEQLLLNSRLQKFEVLEMENQRLRRLLEASFKLSERVVIAELDRKSTRLNSSHIQKSRMPSSA